MPVPNDFSLAIRDMNHWATNRWTQLVSEIDTFSTLTAWNRYRRDAYRAWHSILLDPRTYQNATPERRRNIAWTQLVALWQTAGRGVRGASSVRVHFCDASFAPESARNRADSAETSLLVAMRGELDRYLNGTSVPDELDESAREVCRALYIPWAAMLSNITNIVEKSSRSLVACINRHCSPRPSRAWGIHMLLRQPLA